MNPTPFEKWALDRGHCIAPAVSPDSTRIYADRQTQELYEAWKDGLDFGCNEVLRRAKERFDGGTSA